MSYDRQLRWKQARSEILLKKFGKVDRIILTGGLAYSDKVVSDINKRVGWISEIKVYPGEDELLALAQGAIRVLNGEEQAKQY